MNEKDSQSTKLSNFLWIIIKVLKKKRELTNLSWQACDRRTKNRWQRTMAVPMVVCGLQETL